MSIAFIGLRRVKDRKQRSRTKERNRKEYLIKRRVS